MHCSHFKTHSLQHLKPIKCYKRVCKYKTPTCFGLFLDHLQGILRCALCRYYSSRCFAFVEFVLLRSMWPHVYVISVCFVFLSAGDLLQFLPLICVRWVCIITQYVAACICHLFVFGVLACWWSACEADHQQRRTPNTHRWHIHAATYCVIIQTQRTQISERNSNGTKHNGGPPEDSREKRTKHVGVLYLQTRF